MPIRFYYEKKKTIIWNIPKQNDTIWNEKKNTFWNWNFFYIMDLLITKTYIFQASVNKVLIQVDKMSTLYSV